MLWRQLITSMGFFFLIFLFVGIVGTGLLIGFASEGLVRKRLIETGIRTKAELVYGHQQDPSSGNSVEYAYRDHHGGPQNGHDIVSRSVPGVSKGSQIEIRFDPEKPSRSRECNWPPAPKAVMERST